MLEGDWMRVATLMEAHLCHILLLGFITAFWSVLWRNDTAFNVQRACD